MSVRQYLSTVIDGMAKGLFASLIVGVIIRQIGVMTNITLLANIGQAAQFMMGPSIGVGIAFARQAKLFTLLSAMAAGALGAGSISAAGSIVVGEPMGACIAALAAIEAGKRLEGRSKFDLLIIPGLVILIGGLVGAFVSPVISAFMRQIGFWVNEMTMLHPLPMGILLAVVVGIILTLPISSAALCISIHIGGIAAGAALAGCCAQMVGFAVSSFRENKWSGLISQGIGTSMIQMPNIIKNPWIWLPPTMAAAVTGPLATMVFYMETTSVGAGMGTSGLVGQFTTFGVMGPASVTPMLLLHFVIPAVISFVVSEWMRRKGLICFGDMKL